MQPSNPTCAACSFKPDERICRTEGGRHPENCPTVRKPELIEESRAEYAKSENAEFARQASLQERDGYANRELGYAKVRPAKPRIEEILDFIGKMGYKKVGMAFCLGLRNEAKIVERFFKNHGIEMVSVICKVGRIPKEELGLTDQDKISVCTFETMCNPILQAQVLNSEQTEFNILLGLCVGHDSLFLKYAEAPCTVLAVKDRVTGHNPLAAVYTLDSYYRALK
ncbi:DUF1847 domain-containing protein [Desulfobulbus rhabdoformis]|uniref:DUF1847 domain-containing protein n=1 Tax=Desulfobulbus rhabdoformis TaxID=34032 RepID=UPI0019634C5B|nr:DUF1847 domain-containing protein [Desulfobulbus rhabdoformis]MBM9616002.1 DUF1847 domain-containing protein [Desulfobulbus rhabdoformis]